MQDPSALKQGFWSDKSYSSNHTYWWVRYKHERRFWYKFLR